jgi:hypothetical protein
VGGFPSIGDERPHSLFRPGKIQPGRRDIGVGGHGAWRREVLVHSIPGRSVRKVAGVPLRGRVGKGSRRRWYSIPTVRKIGIRAFVAGCIRGGIRTLVLSCIGP